MFQHLTGFFAVRGMIETEDPEGYGHWERVA